MHYMFGNFSFEYRTVYEIIWKDILEPGRPQMTIWRMRVTCWIRKAANTHLEYVILVAFPLQQRLHDRASVVRCTCIACLDGVKHKCGGFQHLL